MTQPRKIAAEELAKRVAIEYAAGDYSRARGEEVVGFHVGGKRNFNPQKCRIKYMTEAVLLNEMLQNADLRRYALLVHALAAKCTQCGECKHACYSCQSRI